MAKPPRTPATATEITPLLATSSEAPLAQANEETLLIHPGISDTKAADNSTAASSTTAAEDEQDGDEEKPFPVGQVLLCCYCVLTTPIAFFSIFPFINKMIQETGDMPEADVGFYSGLIVCGAILLFLSVSLVLFSIKVFRLLLRHRCVYSVLFSSTIRFLSFSFFLQYSPIPQTNIPPRNPCSP